MMIRSSLILVLLLALGSVFYVYAKHKPELIEAQPASQTVVPCPGPILRIIDPATGKDVTHIDFGVVPVGWTKTVQVMVLNPAASPCNLQIIQLADGTYSFKEIPR